MMRHDAADEAGGPFVRVRRQWDSPGIAVYRLSDLRNVHWAYYSGGVFAPAPWPFLAAYVSCEGAVAGEVAHSGAHGDGCPHSIRVTIVQKDNAPELVRRLRAIAGPKPPSLAALRRAGKPLPAARPFRR